MDSSGTLRARLAFFCLEILLKIKPNEKCEILNFCENLQIWLEILNKKNLKFWLQTITWNPLLLKPFLKNPYHFKEFKFLQGNPPTLPEY